MIRQEPKIVNLTGRGTEWREVLLKQLLTEASYSFRVGTVVADRSGTKLNL